MLKIAERNFKENAIYTGQGNEYNNELLKEKQAGTKGNLELHNKEKTSRDKLQSNSEQPTNNTERVSSESDTRYSKRLTKDSEGRTLRTIPY